jgi:hypothetical protein
MSNVVISRKAAHDGWLCGSKCCDGDGLANVGDTGQKNEEVWQVWCQVVCSQKDAKHKGTNEPCPLHMADLELQMQQSRLALQG